MLGLKQDDIDCKIMGRSISSRNQAKPMTKHHKRCLNSTTNVFGDRGSGIKVPVVISGAGSV